VVTNVSSFRLIHVYNNCTTQYCTELVKAAIDHTENGNDQQ